MGWFRILSLLAIWISICVEVDGNSCIRTYDIDSTKTIKSPGYPFSKVKHTCPEYKYTINAPSGTTLTATCAIFNVQCSRRRFKNYLKIGSTRKCGNSFPTTTTQSNKMIMSFKSENFRAWLFRRKTFRFSCVIEVNFPTAPIPAPPSTPGTECHCGDRASSFGTRIVGGENAAQGEFPYQVSIRYPSGNHFCGGSLISDEWVVTAAHCEVDRSHKVVAGEQRLSAHSGLEQMKGVAQVINHPNYNSFSSRNDVAVVKLSSKVTFSNFVQPICLPDHYADNAFVGKKLEATGWGYLYEGSRQVSDVLQKVVLDVISNTECSTKGGNYAVNIYDENICTLTEGKDACQGDSGGPLAHYTGRKFFLAGITSWGIGCARQHKPGVFADVLHPDILKWIKDNSGITCTAPTPA